MVLFDDESANNIVQDQLGVYVRNCSPEKGLTWDIYDQGIERWRNKKANKHTGSDHGPPPPYQPETGKSGTTVLRIAHFNDVYRVSDQKIYPGGKEETIDVTKFATSLFDITSNWKEREDTSRDGLTVFSGDVFSPSTESSVTRGKHMPPILNRLGIDIGVVGNHEFDFGYPQLKNLLAETRFPWVLSNIFDTRTGTVPEPLKDAHVIEKAGIRIGLIGLVEEDWIATISGWPENFKYQDMAKIGKELSVKLRDPAGEYKCDIVIALTHSRYKDIKLAKALFALSPTAQAKTNIAAEHGVDLLLGGHDHFYWISKGVTEWDGYDLQDQREAREDDKGEILVVKSGTDFQDISEVVLTLRDAPAGSIRKKLIQEIKGKRHVTRGTTAVNEDIKAIVDNELKPFKASMSEPVCISDVLLNVRSEHVRLQESVIGNWVADCLRHTYDEALAKLGYGKVDGVIACTGDFRGDGIYQPGYITLGDLTTILPFDDPTVVVELDAKSLRAALESGLSRHPTQEGRFPAISGLRVSWDSRKPSGHRVQRIWLLDESDGKLGPDGKPVLVDKEEILPTSMRKYLIMCGYYIWEGNDGYDALKGKKLVITGETGQTKCQLIRKFLLGAQLLNRKIQEKPEDRGTDSSLQELVVVAEGQLRKWQPLPFLPQIEGLPSLPKPSLPFLSPPPIPTPSLPSFSPVTTLSFSPPVISTATFSSPSFARLGDGLSSLDIEVTLTTNEGPSRSRIQSGLPDVPNISRSLSDTSDYAQKVLQGVVPAIRWLASQALFTAALLVADHQDIGLLDSYERQRARMEVALMRLDPRDVNINLRLSLRMFFTTQTRSMRQAEADKKETEINAAEADARKALPVIHPVIDGRLKDNAENE
ncbi:Metallo-dependent phosphatase [Mycena galericulata]|nr:Metallo-dependent phosphatase [Mycena galericulata]